MIFGIEALDTVKDLSRKLVTILKQIVNRIEKLENAPDAPTPIDYQPQIDAIDVDLTANILKQDAEKLIQIVAVQRTFKTTSGNADIVAADASVGAVNAWIDRQIKYASQTPNSTSYFIHDATNNRIYMAKPGRFEVFFETHAHRTNFWQVAAEYRPPSGSYTFKQVKGRTTTTNAAVGNEEHVASSFILDIPPGREGGYVYLLQWAETNTTNFRYGVWYCMGNAEAPYNYVDTCTLKITLIEDL